MPMPRLDPIVATSRTAISTAPTAERLRLTGRVQGVGFRPFVFRLASQHGISGWVQNQLGEVEILAQGPLPNLDAFRAELVNQAPPLARPELASIARVKPRPMRDFRILRSAAVRKPRVFVPPDFFMCPDCLAELEDPQDRRYRYPFINCTQCGPRYTLIQSMPYDRPNTSMARFPLCPDCRAEYSDPGDRRFHAEPLACERCGPVLALRGNGEVAVDGNDACLLAAVRMLRAGRILAVKGIGGYHLLCDASNPAAIAHLRERKSRPSKPLAVMFPVSGRDSLTALRRHVNVSRDEVRALLHPSRPIVLLAQREDSTLAPNVAPGLREIGCFLPYSPLHHLLLDAFAAPLVATSGNISGEPVLTDNEDAERQLSHIAHLFLHHDRPIVRPADDSVVRCIDNTMRPLRIGRGMAPRELEIPDPLNYPVLAIGGQMKNTIAIGWGRRVIVSPHIGEMDSPRSIAMLRRVARDLQELYGVNPRHVLADGHPGFSTCRLTANLNLPRTRIPHHYAHASALVAEVGGDDQWIVFTWDGVGMGADGTLWGGECLIGQPGKWTRFASLLPLRPPGGDAAARQPWRSASAMLWEDDRRWSPTADPAGIAFAAWRKSINSPATSAAGRIFDGAASIVCGIERCSYEAQAPMELEAIAKPCRNVPEPLPLARDNSGTLRSDWRPLLPMLLDTGQSRSRRSSEFHAAMAGIILAQARLARTASGSNRVGLTGGVFQNRVLSEAALDWLRKDGFDPWMPTVMPCNDAALSFGQIVEYAAGGGIGDA